MENVAQKIEISRQALEELERRAVRTNGALLKMALAVQRGDLEAIANLRSQAQEANWQNRRALIALGARDSILLDAGLTVSAPDDDELLDTDALSLADLSKAMTGENDE